MWTVCYNDIYFFIAGKSIFLYLLIFLKTSGDKAIRMFYTGGYRINKRC